MGMDLTLYPLRDPSEIGSRSVLCRDRFSFDRDYRILGQLMDMADDKCDDIPKKPTIETQPIPQQMWVETYEEKGVRRSREDKYGTKLTFVYAEQLKRLEIPSTASWKNKAIKAFLKALPNDIPIILYWH